MTDSYLYIIVGLLPIAATMVVLQRDPYHALVIRGVLGAIAAMSYAVLGAADVALTEALVGTMLAITLYAIAVRSSLVMRLGLLEHGSELAESTALTNLTEVLRATLNQHYLRLELLPYANLPSLQRGIGEREVHAICYPTGDPESPCHMTIRVQRLYEIFQGQLPLSMATVSYIDGSEVNQLPVSPEDNSANLEPMH